MPSESSARPPVVFVHGLWLHAESWSNWVEYFRQNGYQATAASWPGDSETTEATRRNAGALAGYGVGEIADHIAKQLAAFDRRPILIGHSFGGLLVQNLLGRNLAAAGIAIDPAPIKGVPELPVNALRSALPVLGNPLNFKRAVALTEHQFRFGFTNALPEQEAKELYAKYAVPGPGRVLFQAATATLNPNSATKVNVAGAGAEHAAGVQQVAGDHGAEGIPGTRALAHHRQRVEGAGGVQPVLAEREGVLGRSSRVVSKSRWSGSCTPHGDHVGAFESPERNPRRSTGQRRIAGLILVPRGFHSELAPGRVEGGDPGGLTRDACSPVIDPGNTERRPSPRRSLPRRSSPAG